MQNVGLSMYDNARLNIHSCTILGHKGGNIVMCDHSQGFLMGNTILVHYLIFSCHASQACLLSVQRI